MYIYTRYFSTFLIVVCTLGFWQPAVVQASPFEASQLNCSDLEQRKARCSFQWSGKRFTLVLKEKNIVRAAKLNTPLGKVLEKPAKSFRGRLIKGDKKRLASLTLGEGVGFLTIELPRKKRFLTLTIPHSKISKLKSGEKIKVFSQYGRRLKVMGCATDVSGTLGASLVSHAAKLELDTFAASNPVIEVMAYGSSDFYGTFGSNSLTVLQALLGDVDQIYNDQLLINLSFTFEVFSTDPFTDDSNIYNTLDNFALWFDDNAPEYADLGTWVSTTGYGAGSGGAVGLAWFETVCKFFGAGTTSVTQYLNHATSVVVEAHELGHNFGMDHDSGIMSSVVSASLTSFSDYSLDQANTHLAAYPSCLGAESLDGDVDFRQDLDELFGSSCSDDPDVFLSKAVYNAKRDKLVLTVEGLPEGANLEHSFTVYMAKTGTKALDSALSTKWKDLMTFQGSSLKTDGDLKLVFKNISKSAKKAAFAVRARCLANSESIKASRAATIRNKRASASDLGRFGKLAKKLQSVGPNLK